MQGKIEEQKKKNPYVTKPNTLACQEILYKATGHDTHFLAAGGCHITSDDMFREMEVMMLDVKVADVSIDEFKEHKWNNMSLLKHTDFIGSVKHFQIEVQAAWDCKKLCDQFYKESDVFDDPIMISYVFDGKTGKSLVKQGTPGSILHNLFWNLTDAFEFLKKDYSVQWEGRRKKLQEIRDTGQQSIKKAIRLAADGVCCQHICNKRTMLKRCESCW